MNTVDENFMRRAFDKVARAIKSRWANEAGYRELLVVALPLIVSTGSWSVQHFVDRMFLAWYSPEAVAASMPAGITNFTVLSLFIGTASFAGTFVAQYVGAGQKERVGPVIWQGMYLAFIGSAALLALMMYSEAFFDFVGHDPAVRALEAEYFSILCLGAFPVIGSSALSSYYIGLGKTLPVMWINVISTAVNVVLDYAMIFGHWGFPAMGIGGAATATVIAGGVNFLAYALLVFRPGVNAVYRTVAGWRFDPALFGRLMRFGLPSGVQFFIDVAGFTIFLLIMGKLGTVALASTNIAVNINSLAFMPMIGFGIAVSTMVGQHIGAGRPELAEKVSWSGFHMTFAYMAAIAALYLFAPGLFIAPFASGARDASFGAIAALTAVLLRYVAIYSLFDTCNIIFASAIKGAGDTRFVMVMIVTLSLGVLVVPTWIAVGIFNLGIHACWSIASLYVCLLGVAFYLRFRGGKWKEMRVIEEVVIVPPVLPEVPGAELEH
ncbi:MAG TPA: MATE family efflux transporter [Spirochaetota bacterium]|nr:MATE family efflux transporter [Spirochaetota bacterium]